MLDLAANATSSWRLNLLFYWSHVLFCLANRDIHSHINIQKVDTDPKTEAKNRPSSTGTSLKASLKVIQCITWHGAYYCFCGKRHLFWVTLMQCFKQNVENCEGGDSIHMWEWFTHDKDVNNLYLKGQTEPHISRLLVPPMLSTVRCKMKQIVNSSLHLNPQEIYSLSSALSTTFGVDGECSWGHQMPAFGAFGLSFIPQWGMLQQTGTGRRYTD